MCEKSDCRSYLKFQQTDSISYLTDVVPAPYDIAVLNCDGSYLWDVTTKIPPNPLGNVDAVKLYSNTEGKLALLQSVKLEDPYTYVRGGAISQDGLLAYVSEENADGTLERLRIFTIPTFVVTVLQLPGILDPTHLLASSIQVLENRYHSILSYGFWNLHHKCCRFIYWYRGSYY